MTTMILSKAYDGESIVDVGRDVGECFDSSFNPVISTLPTDEYGFIKGKFVVNVQWIPEPSCCVCGTTENIHRDTQGYRCDSDDCMVF